MANPKPENISRDENIPPGWTRNPSAWPERGPLVALALAGLGISVYLGLYQLGIVPHVWEPFFGNGSEKVLHSVISRMLPVPDSLLGAAGYAADVFLSAYGGQRRWHDHPWIVVMFGCVATIMALVSLVLLICQPVLAHGWCTLCLVSAFISFCIVGPAIRETRAAIEELKRRKHTHPSHAFRSATS